MSKPNAAHLPARKLNLNLETLRTLTPANLIQVEGGGTSLCQTSSDSWVADCQTHRLY